MSARSRAVLGAAALALAAAPLAAQSQRQTAVLAGGCFWGMQYVFEHVTGVTRVVAGFSGGAAGTAAYETVSGGETGHAESVQITFDPSVVSYETLLDVFFTVAHDPTELNRQGPDVGPQYRSAIFFADTSQQRIAQAVIHRLARSGAFGRPIVTQVVPLTGFYRAEAYHQDYAQRNPTDPYIAYNDLPKAQVLKDRFPQLYREPIRLAASSD
ncbi:MAG TPA: peptide-methionine (S)-S-oxide reductase MsrA [Gemmatimonadales bacterium]|nr:peptide-methionine (S)-S-oxide reductase MsrA [Gemmatimonadales bacterium]